ncbi:MAG: hypothetical protein ACTTH8_02785 [Treponema sp.]
MKRIYPLFRFLIFLSAAVCCTASAFSFEIEQSTVQIETEPEPTVRLYAINQIPDSAEVRKRITDTWFEAPIQTVMTLLPETYTDSKGYSFKVSGKLAEDTAGCYVISVVPELTDYGLHGESLVPQGTWKLYRSIDTGLPHFIKIYPRENSALSIFLRPAVKKAHTGKSFVDVNLYNAYVRKDIAIGLDFKLLYSLALSELRLLTDDVIPWGLFDPPLIYSAVESMSNLVQARMFQLVFIEDTCFDQDGNPVYITDASPQREEAITAALRIDQIRSEILGGVDSAGFVKWVVDGMIRPISGKGTILTSLKRPTDAPHTHFSTPYLEERNLFFGLDWIRNLAAAALSLNLGRTVYPQTAGIDVTFCPFALTNSIPLSLSENTVSIPPFLGYEKNAGYQVTYLNALLYYLAITEPGHFYLGCINRSVGNPSLREYLTTAVFFPYFDSWGSFHLDVFEDGKQISVEEYIQRNSDAYAALVRIRAPEIGLFNP